LGTAIHKLEKAEAREFVKVTQQETMATAHTRRVNAREGYGLWSRMYDQDCNPFLSFEQRFLRCLLPSVEGKDVLDLGCGTGRWLEYFVRQKPHSLVGVDSSPEMLERAKRKVGNSAALRMDDCAHLTARPASADLILCSFVSSYIQDFAEFANLLYKLLRPGGAIFLTDIHAETMAELGWRRGFKVDEVSFEIETYDRSPQEILSIVEKSGFHIDAFVQPKFGEPELALFDKAGKSKEWEKASQFPAIYILGLGVPEANNSVKTENSGKSLHSVSCRIALGARESMQGTLTANEGRIISLRDGQISSFGTCPAASPNLDLAGFLILPGLINPHDHLEFALFPRLGKGGYVSFMQWAADIHVSESSTVQEQRAVPRETRLRWGGLRNLLCGVTMVCHHNPYEETVFENEFPVRVLKNFGWAHSLSLDLTVAEKKLATPKDQPFILHLGEGIDAQSAEDIFRLERKSSLDAQTVVVHGLGVDETGRELMRSSGMSLVWCPSSNVFLFGQTLNAEEIRSFPKVTLGSDSPLTSEGDLLDEIRFARDLSGISCEELYEMVTTKAAQVLCLREGEGALHAGAPVDFFAVADRGLSPAATLAELSYRDVELVVINGRVQLVSPRILTLLPASLSEHMEPLRVDGELRWIRGPMRQLFTEAQSHLANEMKLGGRRVECEFPD
jgi:cytosine/adenosine deaminase-related metal-dependent hydrolase/ubiquinone/menaquinone biosynthesis C-methylase UbiE